MPFSLDHIFFSSPSPKAGPELISSFAFPFWFLLFDRRVPPKPTSPAHAANSDPLNGFSVLPTLLVTAFSRNCVLSMTLFCIAVPLAFSTLSPSVPGLL